MTGLTCPICGLRPSALPLAYCLDCYSQARGMNDLVDVVEIADRLDTTPGTVHSWRRRPVGFPRPVLQLAIGPIWRWSDVARWRELERRPGRPRKS